MKEIYHPNLKEEKELQLCTFKPSTSVNNKNGSILSQRSPKDFINDMQQFEKQRLENIEQTAKALEEKYYKEINESK